MAKHNVNGAGLDSRFEEGFVSLGKRHPYLTNELVIVRLEDRESFISVARKHCRTGSASSCVPYESTLKGGAMVKLPSFTL